MKMSSHCHEINLLMVDRTHQKREDVLRSLQLIPYLDAFIIACNASSLLSILREDRSSHEGSREENMPYV